MTRHHREGVHAGSILQVAVEVSDALALTAFEKLRLEHQLEIVLTSLQRRYIKYVLEHDERTRVLRKLTAREAQLLGLSPEWRRAQREP